MPPHDSTGPIVDSLPSWFLRQPQTTGLGRHRNPYVWTNPRAEPGAGIVRARHRLKTAALKARLSRSMPGSSPSCRGSGSLPVARLRATHLEA
jgi:hypothetical protein